MAKKKNKYNYKKTTPQTELNTTNVVKTSEDKVVTKKKLEPTSSRTKKKDDNAQGGDDGMLFGKENFILIAVGAVLMMIGLLLMTGGHQDPNEWNADEVYSNRRMIVAPLFILAALAVELVAIFKKRATS